VNVVEPILARARAAPDAPAVLTDQGTLSYAELERAVSWTASAFLREGIEAGDTVGIAVADQLQFVISSLALALVGAGQIAVHRSDPTPLRRELERRLRLAGTVGADADSGVPKIAPPPADLAELRRLPASSVAPCRAGELAFLIKRSSGTTAAAPRLGVLTFAMAIPWLESRPFERPDVPSKRFLSFIHVGFVTAFSNAWRCLASGRCLALAGGIHEADGMVEFIRRHGVNHVAGSPVHAAQLLRLAQDGTLLFPGLDAFRLSTSLVSDALRREVIERITPNLFVYYGSTEASAICHATPELVRRIPGVVGPPVRGAEVQVLDEEGRLLPPGKPGRVRVRSPWTIRGYLDDPEATARAFRDGWFHTGDLGEFTAEGALIHRGRADDVMIFDGINISPSEIEDALLRHPAVAEAAAFGIVSRTHGEIPAAAVVLSAPVMEADLLEHGRSWLGLRAPVRIVVVRELPRNAAGKVLKRELAGLVRT